MPSRPAGSSSSADLPPGAVIAGWRIERVLGRGSRATVYEATQLSLDRRVALKIMCDRDLAERVRRLSWPEHPGAVSLFGSGDSEYGPWLAMRLVPGETLETARAPLEPVAAALARAHAAGLVHGDVRARNVLVADGRAYLSDFGLAPGEATAEDDLAALAQLMREHPPPAPRRRRAALAGAAAALAAAGALGVVLASGGGTPTAGGVPPAPAGTRAIGSDLAPGGIEGVDCRGRPPGGGSSACTISQRELDGREVVAPVDGTITSWAVRGARGVLALQVLRSRHGRFVQVERSTDETVRGPGVHVARTDLPVSAGDRVALVVAPEATVGIRRNAPRATTERWFGPIVEPARRPDHPAGTGLDSELLLRVDITPGARPAANAALRGTAAIDAPAGRLLASREIEVAPGAVLQVAVVSLGGAVAVDLLDGSSRLAREPLRGAAGRGRLLGLTAGAGVVRVRWRNPDGRKVRRAFAVTPGGLS